MVLGGTLIDASGVGHTGGALVHNPRASPEDAAWLPRRTPSRRHLAQAKRLKGHEFHYSTLLDARNGQALRARRRCPWHGAAIGGLEARPCQRLFLSRHCVCGLRKRPYRHWPGSAGPPTPSGFNQWKQLAWLPAPSAGMTRRARRSSRFPRVAKGGVAKSAGSGGENGWRGVRQCASASISAAPRSRSRSSSGTVGIARQRAPTPHGDYEGCVRTVAGLVRDVAAKTGATGPVGMGIPGAISAKTGLVMTSNATWLAGKALDLDVAAALGLGASGNDDANYFALAEAVDGAAKARAVCSAPSSEPAWAPASSWTEGVFPGRRASRAGMGPQPLHNLILVRGTLAIAAVRDAWSAMSREPPLRPNMRQGPAIRSRAMRS